MKQSGRPLSELKLFVAVADLRNCYDRIRHEPLLGRVAALPLSQRYKITKVIVKRALGRPTNSSHRFLDIALPQGEDLESLMLSERCPVSLRKEPLVIQPLSTDVLRVSDVVALLTSAVQGCAVTLGTQPDRMAASQEVSQDRFLVRGIPQGSRFSPFLCALQMGGGDASLPAEIAGDLEGDAFYVRLVDDFLYVCAGTEQPCCRFLSHLASQDNTFGGELNLRKCKANFSLRFSSEPEPRFEPKAPRRGAAASPKAAVEVPWAGLTLRPDQGLLNIGASVPRRIQDSLAVGYRQKRALSWQGVVRSKLMVFLDLRLQPLLVDPRLNSDSCVLKNVSQVCKLCVKRFAWLLLRRSSHLGNVQPSFVEKQMLRLAWRAVRRASAARLSASKMPWLTRPHD